MFYKDIILQLILLSTKLKNVIRITSDCPLIDAELIEKIIIKHKKNNSDYTSNTILPTYPDGLDIEIFKYQALKKHIFKQKQI